MARSVANYAVVYAPFAQQQIDAALLWWTRSRAAAPDLLAREIDESLALLARAPRAGRQVPTPRGFHSRFIGRLEKAFRHAAS